MRQLSALSFLSCPNLLGWRGGRVRIRDLCRRVLQLAGSDNFTGRTGWIGLARSPYGRAVVPIVATLGRAYTFTFVRFVMVLAPTETSYVSVETRVRITQGLRVVEKAKRNKKCKRQSRGRENRRQFGRAWFNHRATPFVVALRPPGLVLVRACAVK